MDLNISSFVEHEATVSAQTNLDISNWEILNGIVT